MATDRSHAEYGGLAALWRNLPARWQQGSRFAFPDFEVPPTDPSDHRIVGFLWDKGQVTEIMPEGTSHTVLTDINDKGEVVGVYFKAPFGGLPQPQPFVWYRGEFRELPTPGGRFRAWAAAINNRGQVVGSALTSDGVRCVLWEGDSITVLGTLGGDSGGRAINDRGQVLCQTADRAFLWEE